MLSLLYPLSINFFTSSSLDFLLFTFIFILLSIYLFLLGNFFIKLFKCTNTIFCLSSLNLFNKFTLKNNNSGDAAIAFLLIKSSSGNKYTSSI